MHYRDVRTRLAEPKLWTSVVENREYVQSCYWCCWDWCRTVSSSPFIMVALCNRNYIFILWFLFSIFFPRLISAVVDWMSTILLHVALIRANLECKSEMCYTWLAGNTGRKNDAKNRHAHYPTSLSGWIFGNKACIDNRKKRVKQEYLLHMSAQYGELTH